MTKELAMTAIEYIKKTHETFGLKTESGIMQIPMEQQDIKDKSLAFEKCWLEMCKDAEMQSLPEYDFEKFLVEKHPKLFPTVDKAADFFKQKHEKGDLIYEKGRYRMVR
jgi:hypothetical protein